MSIIKFCVINTKKQNLFSYPFLFILFDRFLKKKKKKGRKRQALRAGRDTRLENLVFFFRGLSIYILLFYVFKQKVPARNTYKKKETGKNSYAILMKTVNQTTLV